ncbi:MAG: tRNA (adenosine(37)-N6)-threonylcarbamoyltransferase complex ATPase subunit type 1 TsaE [Campylobacterota bacterium]|nr:tRNA (adenosine(37)-N6)-threonylcarbamoyltransferase complex ATPase subunit type 1 TsaE [Campylobacterota bacterium]
MKSYVLSEGELSQLADEIRTALPDGGVVILQGDLASGKTTLVKAVAKAFGIDEAVTSPTFSLQQCYGEKLFHYDIYNHGFEHFLSLGMMEELEKEGYHLIEWGDEALISLLKSAQMPMMVIRITKEEKAKRKYEVSDA